MTDTNKYKSIIVRIETHTKLKKLAGKDRKISGIVSSLVDKEFQKKKGSLMIAKDMQEKEKAIDQVELALKLKKSPDKLGITTTESHLRQWLSNIFDQAYIMGERSGLRMAKNIIKNSDNQIKNILEKEDPQ